MNEQMKEAGLLMMSAGSLGAWLIDFANAMHPILADVLLLVGIASGVMSMYFMMKHKRKI